MCHLCSWWTVHPWLSEQCPNYLQMNSKWTLMSVRLPYVTKVTSKDMSLCHRDMKWLWLATSHLLWSNCFHAYQKTIWIVKDPAWAPTQEHHYMASSLIDISQAKGYDFSTCRPSSSANWLQGCLPTCYNSVRHKVLTCIEHVPDMKVMVGIVHQLTIRSSNLPNGYHLWDSPFIHNSWIHKI